MLGLNNIYRHFNSTIHAFYYLYKLYRYYKNSFLYSSSDLRELQLEKLKILLQHAYSNVSYYKKIFDEKGIKPNNINSLEDLAKMPITSRKDIQGLSKQELIAWNTDINKCVKIRTSGSTGMPLDIIIDKQDILIRRLLFMRMHFVNGRKIKDKIAVITTPHHFLLKEWFRTVQYRLRFLREEYISIFESQDNILKKINYYNPDIILGYCSVVKDLARKIREGNIRAISPTMIFLTGEMLTAEDRLYISSIFNTEVFHYYATNECSLIAWECKEHSGYHINSDNVIVELIKEDGTYARAGEEGEIVLTSLNSYTMPFIRYSIGDMGILSDEKCLCGITFPLMKRITGRINDYVILPDGRKISPYVLMVTMDRIPEVKRYQIIQEKKDKIHIKVLQNEIISMETIIKIGKKYKEILGEGINVEVTFVKDPPCKIDGKFKVILSKIL